MAATSAANPVVTQTWGQWASNLTQKASELAGRSVEWLKNNAGPAIAQAQQKAQEAWTNLQPQVNKAWDSAQANPMGTVALFVAALVVLKVLSVVKNRIFG